MKCIVSLVLFFVLTAAHQDSYAQVSVQDSLAPVHVNRTVVAVDEPTDGIPREFALHQNYPNPFNPSTRIQYALPRESHVTLSVYNVLGQEAITLVDEQQPAGFFTIHWDGTNLAGSKVSSGMYFYRLEASAATGEVFFSSLKKLLLVK